MQKPDLSIIIISFNTLPITKDCLDSIYKSMINKDFNFEIVVVDNNSTDGSKEMLKKYSLQKKNLQVIYSKKNAGFGRANNQGVKESGSDYLLLLNSDILVLENAIEKLYNFYKQHENKINFLGGKLLNKDLTSQPSSAPFYTLPVVFGWIFLRGDLWNLTRSSPDLTQETDWVSGACILTKKKYFDEMNGFDENIFMYMDEVDLLYRAKNKGMRVFFYPEARFIHLGSASSAKRTFPVIQAYEGLIFFYKKHYSASSLFILKIMLKLKALIGLVIGQITNNKYLTETYGKAYKMVELAG